MYLKYCGHIAFFTGKTSEAISITNRQNIHDLLKTLDKKYPGIKELFLPTKGIFNSRTGIIIRRKNEPTFSVINESEIIQDNDIITLW